jgi:beta-lactamase class A
MTITRRHLLLATALAPLASAFAANEKIPPFTAIERDLGGRLGVCAIDLATGRTVGHRQDERFPMCSTFKAVLAAQALARAAQEPGFLDKRLRLAKSDLLPHSPVTSKHVRTGMTVAALCQAAVQESDNAGANALMKELGGPAALTAFLRGIGDTTFRLDRWELELNSAIPGDPRDTTSPAAMARSLGKLVAGDALPAPQRAQLKEWMLGTTTGARRIRAGAPAAWRVADKTGTGSYGVANDIAVVFPPDRGPIAIAVYTHREEKEADAREDIVAAAARAALAAL